MWYVHAELFLCKYPHLEGDRAPGKRGEEKEDSQGSRELWLYWTELRISNHPWGPSKPGPRFRQSMKRNWPLQDCSLANDSILPCGWRWQCSLFGRWLTWSRKLCFHRMWTTGQLKAPSRSWPLWRFSCRLVLFFCATAISTISELLYMPFLGKIPGLLQSGFCAKMKHLKACNTVYYIFL